MKNNSLYIASRYILAKKGSHAVTFITWLAAFAMMIAIASMFIIISVFSGLEELNKDIIANVHADLTIKSKSGKTISEIDKVASILKSNQDIAHFSKVIEEKIYLDYRNNGEIAYLRGVDSAYTSVNPIDKTLIYGKYPSFEFSNEVLIENQLDNRLSIPANSDTDFATIFMPKAGKGIIQNEDDIFNRKEIFISGIFPGNDQLNNFIVSPIDLAQNLLGLPKGSAYQIVIKLKKPANADLVKAQLISQLKDCTISTKSEDNAAFWKMINTEKLMIYLIFALVIFITTFNLAGAVTILQLDKKPQAKSLLSLGFTIKELRRTYFYTGVLIVIFGTLSGLILGSLICLLQLRTSLFMAGANLPFPVKIVFNNYIIVGVISLTFGFAISWVFSKVSKNLSKF